MTVSQSSPPQRSSIPYLLAAVPVVLFAITVYYVCATHYPKWWPFYNSNAMLGDAFLHGQTYLRTPPTRGLLSLANPYDYLQRHGVGFIWDASLYNDRYYFYYGPVPALIWAGVYAATGYALSDPQLGILFASFGTLALVWLMALLVSHIGGRYSMAAFLFCILTLSFATWLPFVLRRAAIYETAILGGYCFNAIALLCLWLGLKRERLLPLALASLCFGLAVSCRLSQGLNVIVLGMVALLLITAKEGRLNKATALLCLFIPWLLCLEGLAAYNYVRFGSPFESGWRFALAIPNLNTPDFRPIQPEKFIPNAYFYLLRPLEINFERFPYFFVNLSPYTVKLWDHYYAHTIEPTYGLFTNSPFSLLLVLAFFIFRGRLLKHEPATMFSLPLLVFGMGTLGLALVFCYSVQRYALDTVPWLMLSACIVFMLTLNKLNHRMATILIIAGGCFAIYSTAAGLLSGCHAMPVCNPEMFTYPQQR